MRWIDTHCHLDAAEFASDRAVVRQRARDLGVSHCVIPAVEQGNFDAVQALAHAQGDGYCLGIHPLCVKHAKPGDLLSLQAKLQSCADDPHLIAVGEIGLDFFVSELTTSPLRELQEHFYHRQLKLARQFELPVVLHVRRSADRLLKHLRELGRGGPAWSGIAHAFNGSEVQAREFIKLGFKLGFGGAVTFERALQLRHLAQTLPLESMVLETDAPDIPPHWLYTTAGDRQAGAVQGRNAPGELPRIAAVVAQLRGITVEALAQATTANACQALPKLAGLVLLEP